VTPVSPDLLGGNPAARLSHQVNRIKPSGQRGSGLVGNRSCCGVYVVAAFLAAIGLAGIQQVMFGDFAADFAEDTIRATVILEPFKACVIIGEVVLKSRIVYFCIVMAIT
jgi:hypothetical protein